MPGGSVRRQRAATFNASPERKANPLKIVGATTDAKSDCCPPVFRSVNPIFEKTMDRSARPGGRPASLKSLVLTMH